MCDVKVNWVRLGVTLAPVAGESLKCPDESKLSSVRFLLSPLTVLRTSAPISSACHGAMVGCGNQAYRLAAVRRSNLPKAFPFEGKVGGFSRSDEV